MNETNTYLLAVNCGSSSLRFDIHRPAAHWKELSGHISFARSGVARLEITDGAGHPVYGTSVTCAGHEAAAAHVITWLKARQPEYNFSGIGHRVIHGGLHHVVPEIITDDVLQSLESLRDFAPHHLPATLAVIKAFRTAWPNALNVACYDTAFHHDMPDVARYFAIPRPLREEGIVRYGFNGLSHEYIRYHLKRLRFAGRKDRMIIAHLGNGAGITAVYKGKAIDTTMGLTPAGGLIMDTRSGDLDPGLLLYLQQKKNWPPKELDSLLNEHSGLEALSGSDGGDFRELLAAEQHDPNAAEAIDQFCYQVKKSIGAFCAALGGLDTLVFTGGIGEHSEDIRRRILQGLSFLGIHIDQQANSRHDEIISAPGSEVMVCVIPTDEGAMIAEHTSRILENIPADQYHPAR